MKPLRCRKLGKRDLARAKKQAAKNPAWANDVASSLYHRPNLRFSRGAASAVRIIMKDGKLVSDHEAASQ